MTNTPESTPVVSLARRAALDLVENSTGLLVKAAKGQKNPMRGWDPKGNDESRSAQLIAEMRNTNDNIGIHVFGSLVDVDIDGEDAHMFLVPALDAFLPHCGHIWGRKSRPRTHRIYQLTDSAFDPTEHRLLGLVKGIPEVKVEVRGGNQSRGEYSLLPSSIHPSGEEYEWADIGAAQMQVSHASIYDILRGIRMAGAVAVLGPFWVEGQRQFMAMALAGFLFRAQEMAQDMGDDSFCLSFDDGLSLLDVLGEVTEDDPSDRVARRKAFQSTWKKAADDGKVTGATRLQELSGDPEIVRKLYALLTDNPDSVIVDDFFNRYALWSDRGNPINLEAAARGSLHCVYSMNTFTVQTAPDKIRTPAGKSIPLGNMWIHSPRRTEVAGLTFYPVPHGEPAKFVEDREGTKVNTWGGWGVEPADDPVTDDEIMPFLTYIKETLSGEDEGTYVWIFDWLADIIQNPAERSGTALVLVGEQGTGKSFLGSVVIGPILGPRSFTSTNNVGDLVGKFNLRFGNKLLTQCDEALNSRQRAITSKLKALITDPEVNIEPKGIDAYTLPNHSRYLSTSNDLTEAVHIDGHGDRRFTIIEVTERQKGNLEGYWHPLVKWFKSDGIYAKVHRWLADYEIQGTHNLPLETEARSKTVLASNEVLTMWLLRMLEDGHPLMGTIHKWNWQASDSPADMRKSGVVQRVSWPTHTSRGCITASFNKFSKEYGDRVEKEPVHAPQLFKELQKASVGEMSEGPSVMSAVVTYETRDGVQKSRKRLKRSLNPHDIVKFVSKQTGTPEDELRCLMPEFFWPKGVPDAVRAEYMGDELKDDGSEAHGDVGF